MNCMPKTNGERREREIQVVNHFYGKTKRGQPFYCIDISENQICSCHENDITSYPFPPEYS